MLNKPGLFFKQSISHIRLDPSIKNKHSTIEFLQWQEIYINKIQEMINHFKMKHKKCSVSRTVM